MQPEPAANGSVPVVDQVLAFYERRRALGIARYGVPLQASNGRDAALDALEEAVDLTLYLAQLIIERDGQLP